MALKEGQKAFKCPACGKVLITKEPDKPATIKFTCPGCGKVFAVKFDGKADKGDEKPAENKFKQTIVATTGSGTIILDPDSIIAPSATLKVNIHRRLLPSTTKNFDINGFGSYTIGREDITCPSTIQISGDPTISRRCASIDIEKSANGNALFFFTVIKSRNPIKVNGKELHDGEKLQLKFGDTIVMGKTSMIFTKK